MDKITLEQSSEKIVTIYVDNKYMANMHGKIGMDDKGEVAIYDVLVHEQNLTGQKLMVFDKELEITIKRKV